MVLSFCHGTARPDVQAHASGCPLLQVRTSLAQKMGLLNATKYFVCMIGLKLFLFIWYSVFVWKVLVSCWDIPMSIECVSI